MEQAEVHVCTQADNANTQRGDCFGFSQKRGDVILPAGIERAANDPSAGGLDYSDERRELFAAPPASEHAEAFGRKLLGDGGADVVARANNSGRTVLWFHDGSPPSEGFEPGPQ